MMKKRIKELLKSAEEEAKKNPISPRKFKSTEAGIIILDPDNEFDREWYENDEAYDILK